MEIVKRSMLEAQAKNLDIMMHGGHDWQSKLVRWSMMVAFCSLLACRCMGLLASQHGQVLTPIFSFTAALQLRHPHHDQPSKSGHPSVSYRTAVQTPQQ